MNISQKFLSSLEKYRMKRFQVKPDIAFFARTVVLLALTPLMVSCATGSAAQVDPTPIPTPIVPEKPTYTVQTGTVSNVLELRGRVSPVQQQDLFFRTTGAVNTVNVKRGDFVKAGDVLAYLGEREALESALADADLEVLRAEKELNNLLAEADLKSAEAHLTMLEAKQELVKAEKNRVNKNYRRGSDTSIAAAKAEYLMAENAVSQAENEYLSMTNLPESDYNRINALSALASAKRHRDLARANLTYLESSPTEEEILQADVELAIAKAEAGAAEREYERLKDGPDPFEVRLAEAALEKAKASQKKALASLENLEIVAPFDGEILNVTISAGSQVNAFQNVISIADPSTLEVTCLPTTEELNQLSVGQSALVRLASKPGTDLHGEIRQMPFTGTTTSASTSQDQTRDTSVRVSVEAGEAELSLGELATVIIQLEERQGTLWLPPAALRIFQGRDFVLVQDGEVQRRVDVLIGLRTRDRVEILEGVSVGQVVLGQ
jgi:multidrug efflux pump subunit AcrA (membrane-fusion protein)